MQDDKEGDYEVGYRKPPADKRWKPGQSGNPSGKRKSQDQGFTAELMAALAEPVQVTIDGKTIVLTAKEVIVKKLIAESAKGNKRAFKVLTWLRQQVQEKGDLEPVVIEISADLARAC